MAARFNFDGFNYRKNSQYKDKKYYICQKRDSTNCMARLIIEGEAISLKGVHTCINQSVITTRNIERQLPDGYIENYITIKSGSLELYPNEIYLQLLCQLRDEFSDIPYQIPSKKWVYSKIRENRGASNFNSIQAVSMPPYSITRNGTPLFRRYWLGEIHGEQHQILIWATNESLSYMRYNTHTFIDGTFRATPHPFYQCIIVMVYDRGTETYVPTIYSLLTAKNEYIYSELFHQIVMLMEYNWMPSIITTDFEQALISSIKQEFPESKIYGCYFHLKQAINKKLKKYKITTNASLLLSKIELLTKVPHSEIEPAIRYIQSFMVEENGLEQFWAYFRSIWLIRFDPTIWNSSYLESSEIANRTNNALERYNRRLNEHFTNAHPNLFAFVEVIKQEFRYYQEKCSEIRQNSSGIVFKLQKNNKDQELENFKEFMRNN